MAKDTDIKVLNSLIETTLDSVDGYRDSAEQASDADLKSVFRSRASERQQVVSQLQNKVRQLGGTPEDDGSTLAKAHRMFLDLKSLVGSDRKRVIEEVERGEDYLKEKWEQALQNSDLSPDTLSMLRTCYVSVKSGHDQASAMKHAEQRS